MKKRSKRERKLALAIKQDLQFCFLAITFTTIMALGSIIEKML